MIPTHTFPSRIAAGNIVLIAVLLVVVIYFIWSGGGVAIAISLLAMLIVTDRTIHTEYRLDSERLVVHRGRFARDQVVDLSAICRVDRIRRLRVCRRALLTYMVVVTTDGREVPVMPRREDEFLDCMMKLKNKHTDS